MKGKMKEKAGRTVIGERRLSCITNLKIVLVVDREGGGDAREEKGKKQSQTRAREDGRSDAFHSGERGSDAHLTLHPHIYHSAFPSDCSLFFAVPTVPAPPASGTYDE
jgi:hypothetical protein